MAGMARSLPLPKACFSRPRRNKTRKNKLLKQELNAAGIRFMSRKGQDKTNETKGENVRSPFNYMFTEDNKEKV